MSSSGPTTVRDSAESKTFTRALKMREWKMQEWKKRE